MVSHIIAAGAAEVIYTCLLYGSIIVSTILGIALWLLPPIIGKKRKISQDNMGTVWMLTIIGVLIGITWIVALVLACTYETTNKKKKIKFSTHQPKSFDPIPQSFVVDDTMDTASSIEPESTAMPSGDVMQESCENGGKSIGKLETPSIWKEHIVCGACYAILRNGVSPP